jgi:hypothetical protein
VNGDMQTRKGRIGEPQQEAVGLQLHDIVERPSGQYRSDLVDDCLKDDVVQGGLPSIPLKALQDAAFSLTHTGAGRI